MHDICLFINKDLISWLFDYGTTLHIVNDKDWFNVNDWASTRKPNGLYRQQYLQWCNSYWGILIEYRRNDSY